MLTNYTNAPEVEWIIELRNDSRNLRQFLVGVRGPLPSFNNQTRDLLLIQLHDQLLSCKSVVLFVRVIALNG